MEPKSFAMQSSSDEEEFFSDFQPYEAPNFPSVDLSNFSSVELSDLSTSAGITFDFKSSSILAFVEDKRGRLCVTSLTFGAFIQTVHSSSQNHWHNPIQNTVTSFMDVPSLHSFAAAASLFLSEKLSTETRKFLTIASDRMKQTKLNSMIEEIVEQAVEQNKREECKQKILVLLKVRFLKTIFQVKKVSWLKLKTFRGEWGQ